jgi:hypothetical protein
MRVNARAHVAQRFLTLLQRCTLCANRCPPRFQQFNLFRIQPDLSGHITGHRP